MAILPQEVAQEKSEPELRIGPITVSCSPAAPHPWPPEFWRCVLEAVDRARRRHPDCFDFRLRWGSNHKHPLAEPQTSGVTPRVTRDN